VVSGNRGPDFRRRRLDFACDPGADEFRRDFYDGHFPAEFHQHVLGRFRPAADLHAMELQVGNLMAELHQASLAANVSDRAWVFQITGDQGMRSGDGIEEALPMEGEYENAYSRQ
jgi:hypothetical protein